MRLSHLGATGRTGRLALRHAPAKGHDVVAPALDPTGIALHHSVEDRLALDEVDQCDGRHAYRPALLKDDDRFRHLYPVQPKAG